MKKQWLKVRCYAMVGVYKTCYAILYCLSVPFVVVSMLLEGVVGIFEKVDEFLQDYLMWLFVPERYNYAYKRGFDDAQEGRRSYNISNSKLLTKAYDRGYKAGERDAC